MKNNRTVEISISIALVVLTILLFNPFHFWMPDIILVSILALTFVAFALFAAFLLRENAQDERELVHRMLSGRVAFLIGTSILTLGIIVQSLEHEVDLWLVLALAGMVLSKIFSRIYSDRRL